MDLKLTLLIIQVSIVVAQLSCTAYCMKKGKAPFDVLGGFSIWACFPVIALMVVILYL